MDRLGSEPILPVKQSISIGTMINFDGGGTCKQALKVKRDIVVKTLGKRMVQSVSKLSKPCL